MVVLNRGEQRLRSRHSQSHGHGHNSHSHRQVQRQAPAHPRTDGDEFPRSLTKTAVAQLCDATGFHSIQLSALETLADIASRYLCDLGRASQFYANLSGRSQSNALDVICALEDMGGAGMTEPQASMGIAKSATLADLRRYVDYGEEIPFCKPVPHFPVCKQRDGIPSFAKLGEKVPEPHIPSWLPAFPDVHTYKSTPVWNQRKKDPKLDKLEQARQRRKAERSLVSLHLRLSNNNMERTFGSSSAEMGLAPPSSVPQQQLLQQQEAAIASKAEVQDGTNKTKGNKRPGQATAENPFLAAPLMSGTMGIKRPELSFGFPANQTEAKENLTSSTVALPSALDVFTPALEAARHDVHERVEPPSSQRSLLPDSKDRMPVLMTWDFGRKAKEKGAAAGLSLQTKERKKSRKNVANVDEKDEKKRRAEQILAQTIEGKEGGVQ